MRTLRLFCLFLVVLLLPLASHAQSDPTPEKLAQVRSELDTHGVGSVLVLVAAFVALGFGAQWLFWKASAGVRKWIMASHLDTPRWNACAPPPPGSHSAPPGWPHSRWEASARS